MLTKTNLKIDWATYEAAKYACENWHYSKCLPTGKLVKVGVWENGKYIGVVLFSRGASPYLMKPYGLSQLDGCELTRIALTSHQSPVTKIVSIAIRFLKKSSPGLRLIVSFADPRQGHHGAIYQAGNWVYSGTQVPGGSLEYLIGGKWIHPRSMGAKYGIQGKVFLEKNPNIETRKPSNKHRYLMPLDQEMRRQILPLAKPYPKRAESRDNAAPGFQSGEGGANPTSALQTLVTKKCYPNEDGL